MMDKLNEILDELEIRYPNFYEKHSEKDFEVFKYGLLAKVEMQDEEDLKYVVSRLINYAVGSTNIDNYINVDGNTLTFNCSLYEQNEDNDLYSIIYQLHNSIKDDTIEKFIVDLRHTKLINLDALTSYLENSSFQVITLVDRSSFVFNKYIMDVLKSINSKFISNEFNRNFFEKEGFEIDNFVKENMDNIIRQDDLCMKEALEFSDVDKNIKK